MKGTKRRTEYAVVQLVCMLLLFVIIGGSAYSKMGEDMIPLMKWWGILMFIGVAFYPLTSVLFQRFGGNGYLFGKGVGIAISAWLMWLFASLRWMPFSELRCWICLILCTVINYGGIAVVKLWCQKKKQQQSSEVSETDSIVKEYRGIFAISQWDRVVLLELIFFAAFLFFMYMKGFNPKAYGTEKMMDYGFMTAMFHTDYFPVNDFWFAGDKLNYYYFGQYIMTFLTKLSFNDVAYGYNLALGTGFAFCVSLVYALVYQVMYVFVEKKNRSLLISNLAGALGAVAVTIAGNGHYIVFGKVMPMLWDMLQIPGDKPSYWFPDSTRYIGYVPDTSDKTIHEFPSYSFILGDLHAHVINVTFVLIVLALLFELLMSKREQINRFAKQSEVLPIVWKKEILNPKVWVIGFFIGIFMMTNYWDFPIYFVVSGAVILTVNAFVTGFRKETFVLTAVHAVEIIGISQIVALLFNLNFEEMTNGIAFAQTHTPLYQLVILWGLQILVIVGFVVALVFKEYKRRKDDVIEKKLNPLFDFIRNLEISDLYILILGLCAVGLILLPELIYVVDIYGGSYKRSNTMFKLVYQAFIMFGISMGYILIRFVFLKEGKKQRKWGIIAMVVLLMTCGYFGTAVKAWFGDISKAENYKGMAADCYIETEQPYDAVAIDWIKENIEKEQVILEANGDSYTIYNRVSVLTGIPTVLGWHTHEWLWHNDSTQVDARVADIQTIYTLQEEVVVRELLDKYNVSYIYIGTCEYEKYENMDVEFLKTLGEVVFQGYPNEFGRSVYIIKTGGM